MNQKKKENKRKGVNTRTMLVTVRYTVETQNTANAGNQHNIKYARNTQQVRMLLWRETFNVSA